MNKTPNPILALVLAPLLAGCPQLDVLSGKSTSQEAYEARQSLLIAPEDKPAPVPIAEAYVEPCYKILRVRDCTEDGQEIWL